MVSQYGVRADGQRKAAHDGGYRGQDDIDADEDQQPRNKATRMALSLTPLARSPRSLAHLGLELSGVSGT